MDLKDKIIVVTGAANGIGAALVERFAAESANHIVAADLPGETGSRFKHLDQVSAADCDVTEEDQIQTLIETSEDKIGPIDLFVSNAGVLKMGAQDADDSIWQALWDVNLMSQVYAARHMVPRMAKRGGGYLLNTASAAGLLNQLGSAPYGVTKHASVGLAEWLAFTHADKGIKVSVLCPQMVRTPMTKGFEAFAEAIDGMIEPEDVAQSCVDAIEQERFLVLPHPQVSDYIKMKASDYDRWLQSMSQLNTLFKGQKLP